MVRPRIIATDMDDTCLLYDGTMSPRTFHMFNRAQAAGIETVIVTGRSAVYVKDMQLPNFHYAICCNGASVVDLHTNTTILKDGFTREEAEVAWEIFSRYPDAFVEVAFTDDAVIAQKDYDRFESVPLMDYMKRSYRKHLIHVVPDLNQYFFEHIDQVEKINCFRSGPAITKAINDELRETGLFFINAAYDVDVLAIPKRYNKGKVLVKLAEKLAVPNEAVYAFGDGKNDVVMIEAAGCGVAMGNACDKVKATAQYVCGTCQEDGLAAFIEENFGI